MLRNYSPIRRVDVVDKLSLVDYGDVPTVPGSTEHSLARSAEALAEIAGAGVTTLCLGGDHTILLAELRGRAAVRRPPPPNQLDAHPQLREADFGQPPCHRSGVRRGRAEGLVDPWGAVAAGW